jgi:phosphohistidine phosphatase
MDIVFWRHAEAETRHSGQPDEDRGLTLRGENQAQLVARWLDRKLPASTRIICSPALRCQQTAFFMGRRFMLCPEIALDGDESSILSAVRLTSPRDGTVLVVGHQPGLGQAIGALLHSQLADAAVLKGAVWWLRRSMNNPDAYAIVAVLAPEACQSRDT